MSFRIPVRISIKNNTYDIKLINLEAMLPASKRPLIKNHIHPYLNNLFNYVYCLEVEAYHNDLKLKVVQRLENSEYPSPPNNTFTALQSLTDHLLNPKCYRVCQFEGVERGFGPRGKTTVSKEKALERFPDLAPCVTHCEMQYVEQHRSIYVYLYYNDIDIGYIKLKGVEKL